MALETGTFISDLVVTNPVATDPLAAADDHLRLIKTTIKNTFPNVSAAVTKTAAQINDGLEKSGGTMTGPLTLSGAPTADLHAATKAYIDAAITAAKQAQYPVGSIYTNATNGTNPATLLGFGTWVAFGAGRVPVGFNAADPLFDTAEETGGSKDAVVVSHTHTATVTDPGHSHSVLNAGSYSFSGQAGSNGSAVLGTGLGGPSYTNTGSSTTGISVTNSTVGVDAANKNLQPYITVYMWKRTA